MQGNPASCPPSDATHHRLLTDDDCSDLAAVLFDQYEGRFPELWSLIDNSRQNLQDIFTFFCAMRALLVTTPPPLLVHLHACLSARVAGGPAPIPFAYEALITDLADQQLTALRRLGALAGPAFDLFAAGALAATKQYRKWDLVTGDGPIELPEPDGGAFFYWAEFAFIAAGVSDTDDWRSLLRLLLRAERIYTLAYGRPIRGRVPAGTTFSAYSHKTHRPVRLRQIRQFTYSGLQRFDDLNNAATECARLAFPGGVDTAPAEDLPGVELEG
jgi:hypothetical protein